MRFAVYVHHGRQGLALDLGAGFRGPFQDEAATRENLDHLVASEANLSQAARALAARSLIDTDAVQLVPPFPSPGSFASG
jgi:hypothetical protein